MTQEEKWPDQTLGKIAAGAVALRDCASSIRTRLATRDEELLRLRAQLSALRSTIETEPDAAVVEQAAPLSVQAPAAVLESALDVLLSPPPPSAAPPAEEAPAVKAPVKADVSAPQPVEEPPPEPSVAVTPYLPGTPPDATIVVLPPAPEAPAAQAPAEEPPAAAAAPAAAAPAAAPRAIATSSPPLKTRPSLMLTALPVVCLIGTFIAVSRFRVPSKDAHPKAEGPSAAAPAPVALDPASEQALALVRQWHMAGDDKTVFGRLGSIVDYPDGAPAWSAEKIDDDTYLVIFREIAGTPIYAFEAKLKAKAVLPSPEATDRLTLLRVRDDASALLGSPQGPR